MPTSWHYRFMYFAVISSIPPPPALVLPPTATSCTGSARHASANSLLTPSKVTVLSVMTSADIFATHPIVINFRRRITTVRQDFFDALLPWRGLPLIIFSNPVGVPDGGSFDW